MQSPPCIRRSPPSLQVPQSLPITATRSLPLRRPKFTPNATSCRLRFATNLPLTTSTLPHVRATATTRTTREARKLLPLPFPAHVSLPRGMLGLISSMSLLAQPWSTLRLPLAADRISRIVCSSGNSYPSCDDDDPNDKFELIIRKVLETAAEAVGAITAFIVAGSTVFRHLNEFASKPTFSSLIGMLCGIWEFGIAMRAAYLVHLNAKMRMDCHPKIVDDGHIDTLLFFILKKLLMFYSSSCLLKAGSPPCLVLVLIILLLMLNQVSL